MEAADRPSGQAADTDTQDTAKHTGMTMMMMTTTALETAAKTGTQEGSEGTSPEYLFPVKDSHYVVVVAGYNLFTNPQHFHKSPLFSCREWRLSAWGC